MALRIESLVRQHKELLDLVGEINAFDPRKDPIKIATALGRFQRVLVSHLEIEDRELYPALREFTARPDAPLSLRIMAKLFFNEMESLKPEVVAFLERWNSDAISASPDKFTSGMAGIAKALAARIEREEKELYAAFATHIQATV